MSDQTAIPEVYMQILTELREIKQLLKVVATPPATPARESRETPVQRTSSRREREKPAQ
jgi:hypothetical protein